MAMNARALPGSARVVQLTFRNEKVVDTHLVDVLYARTHTHTRPGAHARGVPRGAAPALVYALQLKNFSRKLLSSPDY